MSFYGIENFESYSLGGGLSALTPKQEAAEKVNAVYSSWTGIQPAMIADSVYEMYGQGYELVTASPNDFVTNWKNVFTAILRRAYFLVPSSDADIQEVISSMDRNGLAFRRVSTSRITAQQARQDLVAAGLIDVPKTMGVKPKSGPPYAFGPQPTAEDENKMFDLATKNKPVLANSGSQQDAALVMLNAGLSVAQQIQQEKLSRRQQQQDLINQQIASGTLPRRLPGAAGARGGMYYPAQQSSNAPGYLMIGIAALGAIYLFSKK